MIVLLESGEIGSTLKGARGLMIGDEITIRTGLPPREVTGILEARIDYPWKKDSLHKQQPPRS